MEDDISGNFQNIAFTTVEADSVDESDLVSLGDDTSNCREIPIPLGSAVLTKLVIRFVPFNVRMNVGYRGSDDDRAKFLREEGKDSLIKIRKNDTDLTRYFGDKQVLSILLCLVVEDGVQDVDDVLAIVASFLTVKVCGALMQKCFLFH